MATSKPAHVPLKSSNLESAGYDAETRALEVKFKHGGTYRYENVAPEHWANLQAADSPGGYLHKHIKSAHAFGKVE